VRWPDTITFNFAQRNFSARNRTKAIVVHANRLHPGYFIPSLTGWIFDSASPGFFVRRFFVS